MCYEVVIIALDPGALKSGKALFPNCNTPGSKAIVTTANSSEPGFSLCCFRGALYPPEYPPIGPKCTPLFSEIIRLGEVMRYRDTMTI